MEKELIDFLKYVKEVHVDGYGHLEICDSGDELDPTVEKVVKDYLKSKEIQSGGGNGSQSIKQRTGHKDTELRERLRNFHYLQGHSCPDY